MVVIARWVEHLHLTTKDQCSNSDCFTLFLKIDSNVWLTLFLPQIPIIPPPPPPAPPPQSFGKWPEDVSAHKYTAGTVKPMKIHVFYNELNWMD